MGGEKGNNLSGNSAGREYGNVSAPQTVKKSDRSKISKMVKMALFCPRLPRESEGGWQLRQQACRQYMRQLHNADILEFETLEMLQMHYRRHAFRRVLVAQSGYYPLNFWEWTTQQRIDVLDVLMRPQETRESEPTPEVRKAEPPKPVRETPRRARYVPLARRGEMRTTRYLSRQF
jgi:hypothetical protein